MSRFLSFVAFVVSAAVGLADDPLVVRGDPLPPGAVARLGIPGRHWNEFVYAGGHTPSGSFRVAVAQGKDVRVWAWQPAHARPPVHHLAGHSADVTLVAISPDGRYLASADKAGEVRVWELVSGEFAVVKKQGDLVTAFTLGDGGWRAVIATGRAVTLHDRSRETLIPIGQHDREVTSVALAPDGRRIATADARGRVAVWNADGTRLTDLRWDPVPEPKTPAPGPFAEPVKAGLADFGAPAMVVEFSQGVRKLAFSPDGRRLAAAGGTVVRAWDIADKRVLWQHNRHAHYAPAGVLGFNMPTPVPARRLGGAWDVAFSRDGHYVASSGTYGDVRVVHAEHGEDLREAKMTERFTILETRFTGKVGLAFGPDGKSITMFDGARKFVRETIRGGNLLGTVAGHGSSVTGLTVSPDGKWLASAGDDGHIRVWRVATGECVADLPAVHGGGRGTSFSPDGKWLVAGGAYHGFTAFEQTGEPPTFALRKGATLRWQAHAFVPGHDARLRVVAHEGSSRSVDLADGKEHGPGFTVNNEPRNVAVSPDGKWVAVAFGYSSTPAPFVFDAATGKPAPPVEGAERLWGIDVVRFSPDSRLLAGGGRDGVYLWEPVTGRIYLHPGKHDRNTEAVAFSPDGRLLASAGGKTIKVWEVATGRLLGSRQSDGWAVTTLAFLKQPGRLASADTEGAVLIWDVSGELRAAAPLPKELGAR